VDELFQVMQDSLQRFLARWYGPADHATGRLPSGARRVPVPLQRWYDITSRWDVPASWSEPAGRPAHHLLKPDMIKIADGKMVFWGESQWVWEWAFEPGGDDPAVFDREHRAGGAWQPTGVALSGFLAHRSV